MSRDAPAARTDTAGAQSASDAVTIVSVVGARPTFMKVAPIARQLARKEPTWRHRIVHTGQHYDPNMSDVFLRELEIPEPDVHLGVGSGTHAEQTARVMLELEKVFNAEIPDLVVVVGDVNSTLAATLVAVKRRIPVAHVEAGLRSFDRDMPEEINRMLTDAVADLLLTPSPDADENLEREGVDATRIHRVGNVMIDSLQRFVPKARDTRAWEALDLKPQGYALVTLHRPSNVDDATTLRGILEALSQLSERLPVVFPVHPRTRKMLDALAVPTPSALRLVDPIGYLDFLGLQTQARLVLTDSGGIQEETTVLSVPCLTLRENTERPITVSEGTNRVVGSDPQVIWDAARAVLDAPMPRTKPPALWDGHTAQRIVDVLRDFIRRRRSAGAPPDGGA